MKKIILWFFLFLFFRGLVFADDGMPYNMIITPIMTGTGFPYGVVSASSYNPWNEPWRAFDGLNNPWNNYWNPWYASNPWVQYDFGAGSGHTVSTYCVITRNDPSINSVKSWILQGSNDGSSFSNLDVQNSAFSLRNSVGANLRKCFVVSSPLFFRYIRFQVTDYVVPYYTDVWELELYEANFYGSYTKVIPDVGTTQNALLVDIRVYLMYILLLNCIVSFILLLIWFLWKK